MDTAVEHTFLEGTFVIHLEHGVGKVTGIIQEMVLGEQLTLVQLELRRTTIKIPLDKAIRQLRAMSSQEDFVEAIKVLKTTPKALSGNWYQTEKTLAKKLHSGSIADLCELVRDTAQRGEEKMSYGRLQFFDAAASRLIKEYSVVFEIDLAEACRRLQHVCGDRFILRHGEQHGSVALRNGKQYVAPISRKEVYTGTILKPVAIKDPVARITQQPKRHVSTRKPKQPSVPSSPTSEKLAKQTRIDYLEKDNQALTQQLLALRAKLEATKQQVEKRSQQLEEQEVVIANLTAKIEVYVGFEVKVAAVVTECTALRQQVLVLSEKNTELERESDETLKASVVSLRAERTKLRRRVTLYSKK